MNVTLRVPFDQGQRFYKRLLTSLLPYAAIIGIVDDESWTTEATHLSHALLTKSERRSWPGTFLSERDSRTVSEFIFTATTLPDVLAWILHHPEAPLPSDVYLLRDDGTALVTTISSHKRSWVVFLEDEWGSWLAQNRSLAKILAQNSGPDGAVTPFPGLLPRHMYESLNVDYVRALAHKLDPLLTASVFSYLKNGSAVFIVGGESRDVLEGRFRVEGGGDLLTDGRYLWRRDTADYVEHYQVGIPMEAVEYFQSVNWVPPRLTEIELAKIEEYVWVDL